MKNFLSLAAVAIVGYGILCVISQLFPRGKNGNTHDPDDLDDFYGGA